MIRKVVLTVKYAKQLSYCVPNSSENPRTKIWRAIITYHRKKYISEPVENQDGNPAWNFTISLVAEYEDYATIKVKDAENRDIGQFSFDLYPKTSENNLEFELILKSTRKNAYPSGKVYVFYAYTEVPDYPSRRESRSVIGTRNALLKSLSRSKSKLFSKSTDSSGPNDQESYISNSSYNNKSIISNTVNNDEEEHQGDHVFDRDSHNAGSTPTPFGSLSELKRKKFFRVANTKPNEPYDMNIPIRSRRNSEFPSPLNTINKTSPDDQSDVINKLQEENERLRALNTQLKLENQRITYQLSELKKELDEVTMDLSKLRYRLLTDNQLQYLEMQNPKSVNQFYQEIFNKISVVDSPFRN